MDRRRRAARTVALMSLFTMADTQTDVPIASFVGDGSDLISLIVGIEPIQAGSGDPSPDNVRPISGWTGANIHVSPTTDAADGGTYSITFPSSAGAVYGGTLDVTTGKLTVDMKKVTYDGSNDEFWSRQSSDSNRFYIDAHDLKKISDYSNDLIADKLKTVANQGWIEKCTITGYRDSSGAYPAQNWIYIQHTTETNSEELKSWLRDNPVTVVYSLATPIVYDLTPTQVTTLIGTNNIWADTGDIKYIEYNI